MKSIFITSTSSSAGKTTVGLCLALNYPGKVGYFKPITTNNDTYVFKNVLHLTEPEDILTLQNKNLKQHFDALSHNKDVLIVESGPDLSYGGYKKLSASEIAKKLDLEPVIVTADSPESIIDKSIMGRACFSAIRGIIINKVAYANLKETDSFVVPSLEKVGLPVLGTVPSYKMLRTFSAQDVSVVDCSHACRIISAVLQSSKAI